MTKIAPIGILCSVIPIAFVATLQLSFAQQQMENNITAITKTSTTSYIIKNDGPEFVDAFDTVYTITGSSNSLNKSNDLVISSIQDDFDKFTPTIGYIRASDVDASSNQTQGRIGLPSPFVDRKTINSRIVHELSDSIASASGLNLTIVTIKCDFGMNIGDWKCEDHGIF